MNNTRTQTPVKRFSLVTTILLGLFLVIGLSGCGGGGGGSSSADNADPTGFYDAGSATIKDPADVNSDKVLPDLRAMIAEDRIMIMSNANAILYDADITDIDGNDFTADVRIYYGMDVEFNVAAPAVINTTMTGTITEGSQVTATVEGTGIGTGSFMLTYAASNSTAADLINVEEDWDGPVNSVVQTAFFEFEIKTGGEVEVDAAGSFNDGLFEECEMTGTVTPLTNTTMFRLNVNVTANECRSMTTNMQEGDHTGLITTLGTSPETLIIMFSNATVAGMGEWE